MSAMRVAMVGLGWTGRQVWLPRLRRQPGITVVGAVDPEPVLRATTARGGAGVAVVAGIDELGPDAADLAVVTVPSARRVHVAAEILAAGIPVFLTKPLCHNRIEADLLAAAERAGGTVLLADNVNRHRTDVRTLHDLVGSVGTPRHIDLSWVRARGRSASGALLDLGWHLLDAVAPVLGDATFRQVVATVSDDFVRGGPARASWRRGGANAAVEDTVRGFLVTDDGVSVALRASSASHELNESTLIRVEGADGSVTLRCVFGVGPEPARTSTLTWTHDGRSEVVDLPAAAIGEEYERQIAALPELLAAATPGRAVDDARRTIEVVERLYASAGQAGVALSAAQPA